MDAAQGIFALDHHQAGIHSCICDQQKDDDGRSASKMDRNNMQNNVLERTIVWKKTKQVVMDKLLKSPTKQPVEGFV